VAQFNEDALMADGFEDAIMGIVERCGMSALVVYDTRKCIDILINRDKMSEPEAWEHFNFNVAGAYMGVNTPLFFTPYASDIPL
jgi:hypothetical protein